MLTFVIQTDLQSVRSNKIRGQNVFESGKTETLHSIFSAKALLLNLLTENFLPYALSYFSVFVPFSEERSSSTDNIYIHNSFEQKHCVTLQRDVLNLICLLRD
eukprot:gene10197-7146_t